MSIILTSEQETIVANLISTGSFQTVDEVLQVALRSLETKYQKKTPAAILASIAALPSENLSHDNFSGIDHDAILYGKHE